MNIAINKILRSNINTLFLPASLILLVLVLIFGNQIKLQFEVIVLAAMLYVGLALVHHHFDKSLTFETIVEYILIATLAVIIVVSQII